MSLDQVLYRLLHDRRYRAAFIADDTALGHSAEIAAALRTVDKRELEDAAQKVCRNLLGGNGETSRGLRAVYPTVLARLAAVGWDELDVVYEFVDSPAYGDYREVPHAGVGMCSEEAFFVFLAGRHDLTAADPALPFVLRHEFLTAMLKVLTVIRQPSFEVRDPAIHRHPHAAWAIERIPAAMTAVLPGVSPSPGDVLWLYAATARQFITGPINPLVERLLATAAPDAEEIATSLAIPIIDVRAAASALVRAGLLPPTPGVS